LKKYIMPDRDFPEREVPDNPPPIVLEDGSEEFEVEKILDHRRMKRGVKYLVRWKGYGVGDDTWEWEEDLENAGDLLKRYKEEYRVNGIGVLEDRSVSGALTLGGVFGIRICS
jgi:hypothetical protein